MANENLDGGYVKRNIIAVMRDKSGRYFVEEHYSYNKPNVSILHTNWDVGVKSFFVYVKETGLVLKDRAGISNINITRKQANKRIEFYCGIAGFLNST